jgi:tellurite resistance protein
MSFVLPSNVAEPAFRALKTVAMADGTFADMERQLLSAAARALHIDTNVDTLTPISPEECAQALPGETERQRLIQAQLIMALIDGEVSKQEMTVIKGFAQAMGVSEPRLHTMQSIMSGHSRLVQFDLLRRSQMIREAATAAWERDKLKGIWRFFSWFQGFAINPKTSWKYKQLGLLPTGTFGRAYWEHMAKRQFSFPGELKGFPEELAKHDLCHVLGEYDTDTSGECEVIGFICGFMKADPFGYLFMIAVHMHLGIEVFQGDPTSKLGFDPDRVATALMRGSEVNKDLYDPSWDYWQDFPLPIEEVRKKYNILPKEASLPFVGDQPSKSAVVTRG